MLTYKRLIKKLAFFSVLRIAFLIRRFNFVKKIKSTKQILIIQLYFIGDVIIITPAIKALKQKFPTYEIDIWIQKNSLDIVKNNPDITNVYLDPTPCTKLNTLQSFIRKLIANVHNIGTMIRRNYEFVIDYSGYFDTALVSMLAARHRRIGLSIEPMLKSAYTDFLLFKFSPYSKVRNFYIEALKPIGIDDSAFETKFQIYLTKNEIEKAKSILSGKKGLIIVMAPFAGWKSKEWPLKNFIELAFRLTKQLSSTIFIIGSANDTKKLNNSGYRLNENIVLLTGKTQLLESAALIKYANLFIGLDSSMAYIAEAFDTPSILLYSSTNSSLLQLTDNPNIRIVHKQLACSPQPNRLYCGDNTILYECEHNYQCMQSISVEEINALTTEVLANEL